MNIRSCLRIFYLTSEQINFFILVSKFFSKFSIPRKVISIIIDNAILGLYGIELTSRTISVNELLVGHSTGVVLGGNGIYCSG